MTFSGFYFFIQKNWVHWPYLKKVAIVIFGDKRETSAIWLHLTVTWVKESIKFFCWYLENVNRIFWCLLHHNTRAKWQLSVFHTAHHKYVAVFAKLMHLLLLHHRSVVPLTDLDDRRISSVKLNKVQAEVRGWNKCVL